MCPLHGVPAVVPSLHDEVHLFPVALPHVSCVELTSHPIEGKAPGIPQAIGPDLSSDPRLASEGIIWGNLKRQGTVYIDA